MVFLLSENQRGEAQEVCLDRYLGSIALGCSDVTQKCESVSQKRETFPGSGEVFPVLSPGTGTALSFSSGTNPRRRWT